MTQGVLAIQYEADRTGTGLTAFGSVPLYIELLKACGLSAAVKREMSVCGAAGWLDVHMVTAALALNLAGGDCVEDLERLEQDSGFTSVLRSAERFLLSLRGAPGDGLRWRKDRLDKPDTSPEPTRRSVLRKAAKGRPSLTHARIEGPGRLKNPLNSLSPANHPSGALQTHNRWRQRARHTRTRPTDKQQTVSIRNSGGAKGLTLGALQRCELSGWLLLGLEDVSEKGEVRSGMGDRRYHVPNHILGAG